MSERLNGKTIALLAADGVEEIEYVRPKQALEDAGARTELVSLDDGDIQERKSDVNPTRKLSVDRRVSDVSADDYDALVLPGGAVNPDNLRQDEDAIRFVQAFFA